MTIWLNTTLFEINDVFIMDIGIRLHNMSDQASGRHQPVQTLSWCTDSSDIYTADGKRVDPAAYQCSHRQFRKSALHWPRVPEPTAAQKTVWRSFLCRYVLLDITRRRITNRPSHSPGIERRSDLQCKVKLGAWTRSPFTRQLFDRVNLQRHILHSLWIHQYILENTSRTDSACKTCQLKQSPGRNMMDEEPTHQDFPKSISRQSTGTAWHTFHAPEFGIPPPTSWKDWVSTMPSWQSDLLSQTTCALRILLQTGRRSLRMLRRRSKKRLRILWLCDSWTSTEPKLSPAWTG